MAALFADFLADKYIVIELNTIEIRIAIMLVLNIKSIAINVFAKILSTIFNTINIAKSPLKIPRGIPIIPKIKPSYKTFFFICFEVAPTDANIPYCFVFSVIEIAKLFRIQNTDVTIMIIIIIPAIVYNIVVLASLNCKFSHLIKLSLLLIVNFIFSAILSESLPLLK